MKIGIFSCEDKWFYYYYTECGSQFIAKWDTRFKKEICFVNCIKINFKSHFIIPYENNSFWKQYK